MVGLGTPTIVATSGPILLASLTKGRQINLNVPVEVLAERYLGVNYNKTGTFTGVCRATAGVVCDQQTMKTGFPATTGMSSSL